MNWDEVVRRVTALDFCACTRTRGCFVVSPRRMTWWRMLTTGSNPYGFTTRPQIARLFSKKTVA